MFENNLTFVTRKDENGNALPMENRRKVFVSYKKSDNRFGLRDRVIRYILSVIDCAVWFDGSLTPGVDYDREISQAISSSDVVVLLLTENILQSDYVWNIEIRQALDEKKGIIPILLHFDTQNIGAIEQYLGHRQLLDGSVLLDSQASIGAKNEFSDALGRALHQFLLRQDLAMCVLSFFAAQKHRIPVRSLSVEQLYHMAFGLLNGLGTDANCDDAVKMMRSLLHLYANDEETNLLKAEIVHTLIKHYVGLNDYEKAKEYIDSIDEYHHAPLYCYVGSLYLGVIGDDREKALSCFLKGAQSDHPASVRHAANLLLRKSKWSSPTAESFERALPYFVKLAELGGAAELVELIVTCWNHGKSVSSRRFVCDRLANDPKNSLGSNCKIASFLESMIDAQSSLGTFVIKEHGHIEPAQRLGEVTLGGHTFFLYRERLDETHNDMLLFRDDKVIYEFSCWAKGFGDIDSFDLRVEDGYIVVKSADFCHYDLETSLSEHVFCNPLSDSLLICTCRFDTKCGRTLLRYPAY